MNDGSIILKKGDCDTGVNTVFYKLTKIITKGDYVHSSIYLDGKIYDFGVRLYNTDLKQGFYVHDVTGDIYEPKIALTTQQVYLMINELNKYNKYGLIMLLSMWWVYPLRKLWKRIGWVPFSNVYSGNICSEAIDKVYKSAGIDLIENELEGYTTPSDLAKSNKLRRVKDGV